jgi:phosphoserine phosphatase
MRVALTLIAAARDCCLRHHAAAVAVALAVPAPPVWLAPDEACELVFDAGENPASLAASARAVIGAGRVDVVAQPALERRKRLLVADLESTIIENEMLDELALILGLGPQIAAITRRAMNGDIDFAAALEARVALLAGVEVGVLDQAAARIRLTSGAAALVATMRRAGAATALVTGGFTIFAEQVARTLGFDHVVANRLEIAAGRLTGKVVPPIVTGAGKRDALGALAVAEGIAPAEAIAVGDGANDLAMLEAAGLGIAFRAKPAVAAAARWRLDHADLTGLLYAQGYHQAEFAG